MYVTEEDDNAYQVHYRRYHFAILVLILPPLVLFEFAPELLSGSLDASEFAALCIGVLLPLVAVYFLVEIASFSFSREHDLFRWRWRNLFRHKALEVPLWRVVQVRRESIESGDSAGSRRSYRLVVMLDDGAIIGLTRGYSSLHDKKLELVVDEIREYLGHIELLR